LNKEILNKDVQDFINSNLKSDITKLILKGSSFSNISIQEIAEQISTKVKCEKKLPTWFSTANIYYPNKLNIEQTSSEITAKYKAKLVSGNSLIDITGGFGVDAYFFSKKVKNVIHCEINQDLSNIVNYNLTSLKINNIATITGDGVEYLKKNEQKFGWIYTDPSRRNDAKGKVFLLEDCLPNIPKNINFLFQKTKNILIKASPILDISSAINELKFVKEIHILAIKNEVKELLFLLEKNFTQDIQIQTVNFNKKENQLFNFNFNIEVSSTYSEPKKYLYEPNAAILKAGAFTNISHQLNIDKLHQHSHLYTSDKIINFPGRTFEIKHSLSYDRKQLKKLIPSKKPISPLETFQKQLIKFVKKQA